MVDAEKESVLMQLLAKAKKNSNRQLFYYFRLKRMSENVSSAFTFGFTLTSVSMASVWSLHPQQVRLHVDFVTQQFGDRTGQVMLEYFFPPTWKSFFSLLHSFTNMEHDVRDLNRLITSSKAIEYTAGKYFYQSFYTWIISCSESCYNKPIFPPLLISLTLSLKSQSHLIQWLF